MNLISLDNFQEEIKQIRDYLEHIKYVNNLPEYLTTQTDNLDIKTILNQFQDTKLRRNRSIFEYKAIIISLYGLLENSVKLWIKEYLDSLSRLIPDYNLIDEKIRKHHFEFSVKLINTIMSRENTEYQHLTKEKVLEKLNSCIVSPKKYQINTEAFVLSSGNLKHNKIVELFKPLNLDLNSELIKDENLQDKIGLNSEAMARTEKDVLYSKINELVETRNLIAHGAAIVNILGISELEVYIDFLEVYCQAIFETLWQQFVKQESRYNFAEITKIVNVFRNSILAFQIENYSIKVGDMLIIKTAEDRFFKKPILEIQLDNVSHSSLKIFQPTNISVRVDHKINKKNQKFYIQHI